MNIDKEEKNIKHNFELKKDTFTNVRIDYKVSGIGSGSCGPQLMEKYQLKDKHIEFSYTIKKLINRKLSTTSALSFPSFKQNSICGGCYLICFVIYL